MILKWLIYVKWCFSTQDCSIKVNFEIVEPSEMFFLILKIVLPMIIFEQSIYVKSCFGTHDSSINDNFEKADLSKPWFSNDYCSIKDNF